MIIDFRSHCTAAPHARDPWREIQMQSMNGAFAALEYPAASEEELLRSVASAQLRFLDEHHTDLMRLSPQGTVMSHVIGASAGARAGLCRRLDGGIEAAFAEASQTMACNMIEHAALKGMQASFNRRAPGSWN